MENIYIKDFCILDIETTGLNKNYDEIIEMCILKVRNNQIIDSFETLIKPTFHETENGQNIYIDEFIQNLTGISNSMLDTAPTFKAIGSNVVDFIKDDVIVGHNVKFDINFINHNLDTNLKLNNEYLDTLSLSRKAIKDLDHHRLVDLARYFNYEYSPHRALNDCKATFEIMKFLVNYIQENNIYIRKRHKKGFNFKDLKVENLEIDENNYFYGKTICFTGKLNNFTRKEAGQICINLGAICETTVNKRTNVLVNGSFENVRNIKNSKSSKLEKAEKLILSGQDLVIIDEVTFLELIET